MKTFNKVFTVVVLLFLYVPMEMNFRPLSRQRIRSSAAVSPRPEMATKGGRRVLPSTRMNLAASDWYRSMGAKAKPRR